MPKLNNLKCHVQVGPQDNAISLPEYETKISDGHIETLIPVLNIDAPFSILLETDGYIAPGLAAYVYIDGDVHCNSNHTGITVKGSPQDNGKHEVTMRFTQKYQKAGGGGYVVRPWSFKELKRDKASQNANQNAQFVENVGKIEVIVLRCQDTAFDSRQAPRRPRNPAIETAAPQAPAKAEKKGHKRTPTAVKSDAGSIAPFGGLFDGPSESRYHVEDGFGSTHDDKLLRTKDDEQLRLSLEPLYHWDATEGAYRRGLQLLRIASPEPVDATSNHVFGQYDGDAPPASHETHEPPVQFVYDVKDFRKTRELIDLQQNALLEEFPIEKPYSDLQTDLPFRLKEVLKDIDAMRMDIASRFAVDDHMTHVLNFLRDKQVRVLNNGRLRYPIYNTVESVQHYIGSCKQRRKTIEGCIEYFQREAIKQSNAHISCRYGNERLPEIDRTIALMEHQIEEIEAGRHLPFDIVHFKEDDLFITFPSEPLFANLNPHYWSNGAYHYFFVRNPEQFNPRANMPGWQEVGRGAVGPSGKRLSYDQMGYMPPSLARFRLGPTLEYPKGVVEPPQPGPGSADPPDALKANPAIDMQQQHGTGPAQYPGAPNMPFTQAAANAGMQYPGAPNVPFPQAAANPYQHGPGMQHPQGGPTPYQPHLNPMMQQQGQGMQPAAGQGMMMQYQYGNVPLVPGNAGPAMPNVTTPKPSARQAPQPTTPKPKKKGFILDDDDDDEAWPTAPHQDGWASMGEQEYDKNEAYDPMATPKAPVQIQRSMENPHTRKSYLPPIQRPEDVNNPHFDIKAALAYMDERTKEDEARKAANKEEKRFGGDGNQDDWPMETVIPGFNDGANDPVTPWPGNKQGDQGFGGMMQPTVGNNLANQGPWGPPQPAFAIDQANQGGWMQNQPAFPNIQPNLGGFMQNQPGFPNIQPNQPACAPPQFPVDKNQPNQGGWPQAQQAFANAQTNQPVWGPPQFPAANNQPTQGGWTQQQAGVANLHANPGGWTQQQAGLANLQTKQFEPKKPSAANNQPFGWEDVNKKQPSAANNQAFVWGDVNQKQPTAGGWGQPFDQNKKPTAGKSQGWGNNNQQPSAGKNQGWDNAGWGNNDNNKQPSAPAWDANPAAAPANNSKATTAKSRGYAMPDIEPKPYTQAYWQNALKSPTAAGSGYDKPLQQRSPYKYPAEPKPALAADQAPEATHGVHAGKGAFHTKQGRTPSYIDTLAAPYAVFTFKYGSKEAVEKAMGRPIDVRRLEKLEKDVERALLGGLPRHRLAEMAMAGSPAGKAGGEGRGGAAAPSAQAFGWGDGAGDLGGQQEVAAPAWQTRVAEEPSPAQQGGWGSPAAAAAAPPEAVQPEKAASVEHWAPDSKKDLDPTKWGWM